ncbi:MAG TPA: DUF4266 domain-containing protein [Dokdonella sp.]|jgi:hypothetical protein|nr:DUF4266 domain-containing protein [Dokdonella sp.]
MPRAALVIVLAVCTLPACVRVHAYQRAELAARGMASPVWPELDAADEHVFVVREGTGGATAAGGGGCGCN